MSKVNAMQAIREARYAARASAKSAAAINPVVRTPDQVAVLRSSPKAPEVESVAPEPVAPEPTAPESVAPEAAESLCGHRSMNNRICRRPAGHAEKNHRYN